ncbi:MAG: hypothetical protein L6R41_000430 [Letrouitia leprolyta]|nr:MAG: hypothetical protein L6R41_000430 [Letrouitia leprolyta]
MFRRTWTVVTATWPSMHDPVTHLLNAADDKEADELTEKWTQGKLQELQYVGLSSALVTGTIASAFSWYSVASDPWTTEACWASAMVMARTAISLASQQTIGLSRLCSCEDGWLKGEDENESAVDVADTSNAGKYCYPAICDRLDDSNLC